MCVIPYSKVRKDKIMTIQTPASAVQDGHAALRATLFERNGAEKLRNLKFYLKAGGQYDAADLANAAARLIDNRRSGKVPTLAKYDEASRPKKTAADLIASLVV